MTGRWYRKDVPDVWMEFFSYGSGDGDELMGIEVVVLTTIFPRWWGNWGDRRELKLQRGGASGWGFKWSNSQCCCIEIDGRVRSRGLGDR